MRTVIPILFATIAILPSAAGACSCVGNDPKSINSVREHYDHADMVILGKVEEVVENDDADSIRQIQTTTLFVLASWKGEKSNRVLMKIDVTCCMCGYSFRKDETHLIFGYEADDGFYATSICSMSMPAPIAEKTVMILDELAAEEQSPNNSLH